MSTVTSDASTGSPATPRATPAIAVCGLTHRYPGGEPVLRGLDLRVEAGHVTAVLGPSGCGKTTLLRAVAGFLTPDGGTVSIAGSMVSGAGRPVPPRARHIGYVAQEGALFPHRDVAGNIAFGLAAAGRQSRARLHAARVDELLALVGLDPAMRDRMPHQLSGGQQQRVALARALAPRPSVILLDEPFSALDTDSRRETSAATAAALRAGGVTALLITHDPAEAMTLADSVAVLQSGRVAQHGTPEEVYARPVSAGVATTLGAANLLAGRVVDGRFECALGSLRLGAPGGGAAYGWAGPGTAVVRPEGLMVRADPGARAVVLSSTFHGTDHALSVRLETGELLSVRGPSAGAPRAGERVTLEVPAPVHLLPSP
ncbi:MAG: ABC transporter ATP-binding protein [Actinomycetota bacterium]|nr:ABC transporter ATP-binding protein [Actinomycetota bacterium]